MYADDFEAYLRDAPILHVYKNAGGGGHPSFVGVLAGGGSGVLKFEDGVQNGAVMVRREAAAWTVAKTLGWTDLVAVTVLRQAQSTVTTGTSVTASIQVLWPRVVPDVAFDQVPDDDIERAAVFDYLVWTADRGHNWLIFEGSTPPRLKLVDHGHTCDSAGPLQSVFYDRRKGQALSASITTAL